MIKKGSLYCASDKALNDALRQHKMTKTALHELMYSRGMLVSNELDKEDIALHLSRINHDYFDHALISEKLATSSRKEKHQSKKTTTQVSRESIEEAIKQLIDNRQDFEDEITHTVHQNSIEIDVTYSYLDYNKSEFKQLVKKDATISIEFLNDEICIRNPDNEYIGIFCEELLDEIEKESNQEVQYRKISLSGTTDPRDKIRFFEHLISNIDGFDLYNVSDVTVFHPDSGEENKEKLGTFVKKASLNGDGIFESGELKDLFKKGFYIYKVSWASTKMVDNEPRLYLFHAQFNDPEFCSDFSYLVKGYRPKGEKSDFSKQTKPLTKVEDIQLMRRIETCAYSALDEIKATSSGGQSNEQP
ncbi:MAG: hypothetical protein CMK89_12205 [Pseudomonadales bacterium]|nr:hypothetical protein [Pseudomonadales bacterium]